MEALCAALALFIGNVAIIVTLFIWNRSESRTDIRHMDNKLEIYITSIREETKIMQQEIRGEMRIIQEEIKDFHGRLCAIEEKNKK